jgi:hypothetical protein
MAAPRLRRVGSKKELENMLDDYMTQGYEIIEQGQTTAMVRRKTWGSAGGHVLWALLTFWFTLGLGNLVYALVAHYNAEKVMLKIDADTKS